MFIASEMKDRKINRSFNTLKDLDKTSKINQMFRATSAY